MDSRVITIYESFKLGYCRCDCGTEIKLKNKTSSYLLRYALNHHTKGKEGLKGFSNGAWKTGRTKKNEYWYIRIPTHIHSDKHGYVAEHVYNFTEFNHCCMLKWGIVHHIDENTENNMPWNLQGMMWGSHTQYHCKINTSNRRCSRCGGISKSDWFYDEDGNLICRNCYFKNWYKKSKNKE